MSLACAAAERVVALAAHQQVVAFAAGERVGALAAEEVVVAGVAADGVVAFRAEDAVRVPAARVGIVVAVADDEIDRAAGGQIEHVLGQVGGRDAPQRDGAAAEVAEVDLRSRFVDIGRRGIVLDGPSSPTAAPPR